MAGGRHAAGTRHVLRHDRRVAGNEPAEELRGEAAIDVVAAAGAVADDQPELLALVEIRDRIGAGGQWQEHKGREHGGDDDCERRHGDSLVIVIVLSQSPVTGVILYRS